jgi:carboxyl-terminal processing protease
MDLDRSIPFIGMDKYQPLGALKVTIQKFYRVSGESTQYRGVVPDIVLPDRLQYLKTGEQYIDYSLPWDTVSPTEYSRWGQIDLAPLKEKSRQRIQTSSDFVRIRKEMEQARIRSENTRQSLHIDDFRKLRAEAKKMEAEDEMHGMASASGRKKKQLRNAEERHKEWIKQVKEDPFATEAMSVLEDLLSTAPATRTAQK